MKDPTLIKGEDLLINGSYRQLTLTVSKASVQTRKNESGEKEGLLIYFEKATKPLFCPLDQLNYRMIKAELGTTDPAAMVGKKLTIIPVKGDWFGERNTLAVRVLVTGSKPKPRVGKAAFGEPVTGLKVAEEAVQVEGRSQ
jgi:hypothetical protein